ncbi:MAG: CotH kinase family protein [Treponema sp.]|nr:CotH kinase family protein [Treponema sp.]
MSLKISVRGCSVFIVAVSLLFVCCKTDDSDDFEDKQEITTGFSFSAYGRDKSIFLQWSGLSTEKTVLDFEKVSIEYSEAGLENAEIKKVAPVASQKRYLLSNLENEKEYSVKFTGIIKNQPYSKTVNIVPKSITYNFERVMGIVAGGKTYISFTLKEFEDAVENISEPDVKDLNLYDAIGEKLFDYKITKTLAHEKIDPEIKEDGTKAYKKYYSIVVDDSVPDSETVPFLLRILNSENIESAPLEICVKKITLPAVNIAIPDFEEENLKSLEKFKNKEKLNANLEVFGCPETEKMSAALTIKGRGNSSWNNAPKKSYTLKFSEKQNFLGFEKNKSFALIANYFDKTLLRNQTSYELAKNVFTEMPWNPGAKSVNLFINNVYQGVYLAVESIKIGKKRVNIPDIADCKNIEEIDDYGFILEIDSRQDENFNFTTTRNVPFSLKESDGDDLQTEVKTKIEEKIQNVENAIYSDDFAEPESQNYYGNFLNIDSFVDWWLLQELAKNTDSNFYSSCYIYFNPTDNKFWMGPVWDFDLGWGNINTYNPEESYIGFKADERAEKDGKTWESWIVQLLKNENFKNKAKKRWSDLKPKIEEYFSAENVDALSYESNFSSLQNDAELNFERWPILGEAVWKAPIGYEGRKTYEAEKKFFIDWKDNRIQWLEENL